MTKSNKVATLFTPIKMTSNARQANLFEQNLMETNVDRAMNSAVDFVGLQHPPVNMTVSSPSSSEMNNKAKESSLNVVNAR